MFSKLIRIFWSVTFAMTCVVGHGIASEIEVPNLRGLSESEARYMLTDSDIAFEFERLKKCPGRKNTVTWQTPEAGVRMSRAGAKVYMKTNSLEGIPVPDTTDLGEEAALELLRSLGIRATTVESSNEVYGPCPVILGSERRFVGTEPGAGEKVCRDTGVKVQVRVRIRFNACQGIMTKNGCKCF